MMSANEVRARRSLKTTSDNVDTPVLIEKSASSATPGYYKL